MRGRTTKNSWAIFALICIPIFIGSVDLTSIVVVLPQATLDLLGVRGLYKGDLALWAVTAYLLAYTVSLALVGRLSDTLSRKRVFFACVAIFVVGALWAGLAQGLPLTLLKALPIWPDLDVLPLISLVIGRVIQAIGAGASVSVGMALVADIFPPDKRDQAISLIGAIDSLGWVIGNLYAGLMLQLLPSWRDLFLINAGVAFVALILVALALRETPTEVGGEVYDGRGALLFGSALITLTVGIEALKDPSTGAYLLLGASVLLLVAFLWRERHTDNALFDLKFFELSEVRVALLTNLIVGFGLILMVAGVPLIINLRTVFLRGESLLTGALRAGIMLSAMTVPLIVAVLVGERRYRRVGAAIPVTFGLAVALLGFVAASQWTYTTPNVSIALPLALVGIGLGMTIGPLSLVVVDSAYPSERGLAVSLVLMMRLLGMTFGTPLAASLTLNLANQWATERTADMTTFHDIARSMLIPPMATDALARVMLAGVLACAIALTLIYVPRAIRTMRHGPGLRALFAGSAALVAILIIVSGVAVADSLTTPTIQENTIARELPANVTVYAGLNLQELFLKNTQRPLDAILQAAQVFLAPVSTPAPAATQGTANQAAPPAQSQASQPSQQAAATAAGSASTPVDDVIRALLRARNWSAASYKPFCPDEEPPENWQGCFANSLLSWVGPQSAFAMMPAINGGSDLDFLFAFQATNRNNAIGFATNLATALGEAEPVAAGPNVRLMTINGGTSDERSLAITQAYVLIGTPRAIQATLEHGQDTLAAQADFQAVTTDLPTGDFATLYMRANSFHGDLEPALKDILSMEAVDSTMQIASAGSLLSFVRTTNAPAVIGLALRADEQQITVDGVANTPYDLQKLDASAVGDSLLNRVPAQARSWAALNVDVAGLVGGVNVPGLLGKALPGNSGFIQGILGDFGQSLQKLMGYAKGGVMITELPVQAAQNGAQQAGQGRTEIGLVVPMLDRGAGEILPALKAITGRLQIIGGLSGAMQVTTTPATEDRGEVGTLRGAAQQASQPTGLQYTLTKDSVLILTTGQGLDDFLASFKEAQKGAATKMHAVLDDPLDRFMYAYADLSPRSIPLTAVFGGQVRQQAVYVTLVLKAQ